MRGPFGFGLLTTALLAAGLPAAAAPPPPVDPTESELLKDWIARWERHIVGSMRNRYCDRELGEEIGWLVSPFTNGFYYGYRATGDPVWIDRLIDWTDAWTRRGLTEPDGYLGWPKPNGASTPVVPDLTTDNLLGEAMGLRPAVLMARDVLADPALEAKYGERARAYLALAEQVFEKWDRRGCWRTVERGGVWVVPLFGLDAAGTGWVGPYDRRDVEGFTLPANKLNHVARWLLALYDATGKEVYRERAEQWFVQMKARLRLHDDERYYVWNYWDPAGPWDYKPDGGTKHWVGVHPNGGYYAIDVEGIVDAYEHGLVFDAQDIDRLIATNRDFMWNRQTNGARFGRIDGGPPDERWKNTPGVLWTALAPYDETLWMLLEANHDPASWGGLALTPWFVATRNGTIVGPRRPAP